MVPYYQKEVLNNYFTLSPSQKKSFLHLAELYKNWNLALNIISRKDIKNLYVRHFLHSLSIAKIVTFKPGSHILDIGTGGGLPGLPLAIMFPDTHFTLIDSITKKIKVVQDIVMQLRLHNVSTQSTRAEQLQERYDFIVCRAVATLDKIYTWTEKNISKKQVHNMANGWLCLKGGDLNAELAQVKVPYRVYKLREFFGEEFFLTKSLIYVQGATKQ